MPKMHALLPTQTDQDEDIELEARDPASNPQDPAHPMWLEEFLWTAGVGEKLYNVSSFLAEERDIGYGILAPMYAEEPTEDSRDWGPWAFHGALIYDLYED